MTTKQQTQHRVTASMIQLTGPHSAGSAFSTGIETIFRQGDVLPSWATDADIERLTAEGFIEAMPA